MMVYISRCNAKRGDGDKIKWNIGEKALFHARSGVTYNVTIVSDFVQHPAARDKRCIEVTLDLVDGGKRCVLAELVEPFEGWPRVPDREPLVKPRDLPFRRA